MGPYEIIALTVSLIVMYPVARDVIKAWWAERDGRDSY